MQEVVTAEMVSRDAKLVSDLLQKLLYDDDTYYHAIMKDLQQSNDLSYSLAHISLAVLEGLKEAFKRPMYPEILYVAGNYVISQINSDLKQMGHESLDQKGMQSAVQKMLVEYMEKHKDELDMRAVGAKLKALQTSLVDGSFSNKLATYMKVDKKKLLNSINSEIRPKSGVVPKHKKAGVLNNEPTI